MWDGIKTPRLLLREFTLADVDGYYKLESNEENARYQDWAPRTKDEAQLLVLANMESSSADSRNVWELVVEHEGEMIGRVGAAVTRVDADESAKTFTRYNFWYSFLPSVQGKGLATEAMTAFIDTLVAARGTEGMELEIECDPRNTGSRKLAERLGFKKHSLTENAWESKGEWVDSLVYRKAVPT
ncbi:acyl-CoA N-acyltransferase [Phaeosphaeria sp. MPI-PUGE-AT-0046c]|nr:acyl-CoA N-acyltransferase [Phaeosphaeria sp. MPI-PUGE-AT-0046c]